MNLLAASPDGRTLLVGSEGQVLVLPLSAAGVPRVIESTVALGLRECDQMEEELEEDADAGLDASQGAPPEPAVAAAGADAQAEPEMAPASPSRRRMRAPSPPPPPPPHNDDVSTLYAALSVPPEPSEAASARRNPLRPANTPAEVNALRVGWIGNHPVLIVATMGGHSCCFDLDRVAALRFGPGGGGGTACLHAAGASAGDPDLVRLNQRSRWQDNSAWSVCSTPRGCAEPMVLIGSNACRAFIWRVGKEDESDAQTEPECKTDVAGDAAASSAAVSSIAAASGSSSASAAAPISRTRSSGSDGVTTFIPAGHNVPSVDISSCGRFAALACIDAVVRLARLDPGDKQGDVVATRSVGDEWGWTVRFVPATVVRQVGFTYAQMERHRAHAPLPDELIALQPSARPAVQGAGGAAHPMLAQMVEQLMLQVAADMPAAAAAAMRADLRRQLEQLLRQQMQEPPEEEEEEEDEGDEFDVGDEDEDEDDMADDAEEGDDDDQPPELADSDAEDADADADAVAHHEMGWEAGFEPQHPEEEEEEENAGGERAAAAAAEVGGENDRTSDSDGDDSLALSGDSVPSPLRSPRVPTPVPEPAPRPTDLLIYTSKSHVHLLDGRLNVLASVRHVCQATLTVHRALHRTLFVECIPALGVVLLASSASDRVLIYRPMRFACGRYALEVQGAMPQRSCGVPIKGVSVCRVPGQPHRPQAASLQQQVRRMAADAATAAPTTAATAPSDSSLQRAAALPPALVTRTTDCWRVHVLYADEHMAAFELAAPRSHHAFDIANLFD